MQLGGIDLVTTLPAPTITLSPISTPPIMHALLMTKTLSPSTGYCPRTPPMVTFCQMWAAPLKTVFLEITMPTQ